jgi:UDP-N-acetylglucosamine--N-acetylmuramyl-(pentapeptide) pyrophosphoryl-undecaprenol N-acetylglucosamine transferase
MRIVVTGGGTGGHVYPAIEVAKAARDRGWEVCYFGSHRGQEGKICKDEGFDFQGFPSEPIYSIKSIKGLKAAGNIWRATQLAKKCLVAYRPQAVFSTGGYSSAPVVSAAKALGIPYVIHEQNTVPGRTNHYLAKRAYAVATTFFEAEKAFPGIKVVRTGMPVRRQLRSGAQGQLFGHETPHDKPLILVMGGSQGAVVLNEAAMSCAMRMSRTGAHWLTVAGTKNYDAMHSSLQKLAIGNEFDLRAYLDGDEMANALFKASVVVCRSGGSLAELAVFRKPSVLVPFPSAMGNHQYYNAKEFADMGAALILEQKDLEPALLEARILAWLDDPLVYENAQRALAAWDVPDAVDRILNLLAEAAASSRAR